MSKKLLEKTINKSSDRDIGNFKLLFEDDKTLITHWTIEPGKQTGWLVNPDDPYSLSDALIESVENQNLREAVGRNARDYIERMYSWDNISDQFTKTYHEILSRK